MKRRKMIIDGFDTWEHGRFTMTEFNAPQAEFVEEYQDVPGYDGILDFTDLPLGRPRYKTRTVSAVFECSHWTMEKRQDLFDQLIAQVQGRVVKITDPDHPDSHFLGRVYLRQSFNKPTYGKLELTATCDPWRYSNTSSCELIKIQTPEDNLLTDEDRVSYLADLSNDERHTSGGDVFSSNGEVGRVSYWSIALSPNTSYYITGQIRDGRGAWGCADSPDSEIWNRGIVHTGQDGILYLRMESYSKEWLVLSQVVLLPGYAVPFVENGVTATNATITLSVPFPTAKSPTLMYSTDGTMRHVYNGKVALAPGRQPLLLYSWLSTPQAPAPVSFARSDY